MKIENLFDLFAWIRPFPASFESDAEARNVCVKKMRTYVAFGKACRPCIVVPKNDALVWCPLRNGMEYSGSA